jgi:hypothetical protein
MRLIIGTAEGQWKKMFAALAKDCSLNEVKDLVLGESSATFKKAVDAP